MQSSGVELPALEFVRGGHEVQFEDPVAPEYVPAGHARHDAPPVTDLYWPVLHAARAGLRVEGSGFRVQG